MGARFVRELSEKAEVMRMTAISDFSVRRTTHLCVYKFLGNKCELNLNESGVSCREAVILFVLTRMCRTLIEGFSAVLRVTSHIFTQKLELSVISKFTVSSYAFHNSADMIQETMPVVSSTVFLHLKLRPSANVIKMTKVINKAEVLRKK